MFYHLFYTLSADFSPLNIFRYITVRGACAFITSFSLVMLLWPIAVKRLKSLNIQEKIDMYGHVHLEALHGDKKGTPTMGGLLIVFSVITSVLFWARWDNNFVWYAAFVMLTLALVGLRDDSLKVRTGKGLIRRDKLFFQCLIGIGLGFMLYMDNGISNSLTVPFFKNLIIDLGCFYVLWSAFIVIATSNAVNFTDGLDGLAIGVIVMNCVVFAILGYIAGHFNFARYLFIPYVEGAGELSVFCASVVGAGLGFLWFNSHPAQIFMGDVGALALGGVIGAIAVFIKKEFLLIISGGIFVMEGLSVVLQILSVRLRGKKIFKAAPMHHHLQLLGWPESKVVVRLWILAIILAVVSLMTIKVR